MPRAGGSAASSFTNMSKFHPKRAREGAGLGQNPGGWGGQSGKNFAKQAGKCVEGLVGEQGKGLWGVPGGFVPPALQRQVTSRVNILSGMTVEAFLWI